MWKLESKGLYTVKSLYVVVNFRGIVPIDIASVWNINVPPKIQFFFWLFAHNKLLTRDNLVEQQQVDNFL